MKNFSDNIRDIIRKCDMTRSEYRKTLEAVESGNMVRIRQGVLARSEALLSSDVEIESIVPGGILCLYSAWSYHRLSTQIPNAFYVAVKSKRRIVLPSYPEIRLVYVSDSIIDLGVMRINTDGTDNLIYDIERSVCDAIKYRNKIGTPANIRGSMNVSREPGKAQYR